MKFLLSLSADTWAKGDRVAFKAKKDEWYVGTVTSVRQGLVGIIFDDGVKGSPAKPSSRTWLKLKSGCRQIKKDLTDAQVSALPLFVVKTAPAKPAAKPTRIKITIKAKPKAEKITDEDDPNEKFTAEEKAILKAVGSYSAFAKAHNTDAQQRRAYLKDLWHRANKAFFSNKLLPCNIYLQKDMGAQFRRRGVWFARRRLIGVSPRLFKGSEVHVITTFVHEMCHQAVSEIDRVPKDGNGGHGPHWSAWMRKCNLTPARYCKYDNETFMDEGEKAKFKKQEEEHKKRIEQKQSEFEKAAQNGMKRMYPRDMTPAQYYRDDVAAWRPGLIVCRNDQKGDRWCFLEYPSGSSWRIVPNNHFFELPKGEHDLYLKPEWQKAAGDIVHYKDRKKAVRAMRKSYRIGFGF